MKHLIYNVINSIAAHSRQPVLVKLDTALCACASSTSEEDGSGEGHTYLSLQNQVSWEASLSSFLCT